MESSHLLIKWHYPEITASGTLPRQLKKNGGRNPVLESPLHASGVCPPLLESIIEGFLPTVVKFHRMFYTVPVLTNAINPRAYRSIVRSGS